jgi:hypothetical protein
MYAYKHRYSYSLLYINIYPYSEDLEDEEEESSTSFPDFLSKSNDEYIVEEEGISGRKKSILYNVKNVNNVVNDGFLPKISPPHLRVRVRQKKENKHSLNKKPFSRNSLDNSSLSSHDINRKLMQKAAGMYIYINHLCTYIIYDVSMLTYIYINVFTSAYVHVCIQIKLYFNVHI